MDDQDGADQDRGAPLAGMRVLEISSFVAAPLGGMTLAQLGAEVIRIDPLGGAPDVSRWPLAPNGGSLYWAGLNKGKRSVTLDLRSPAGQRAVADLVANSGPDGGIVLTNAGYPWLSYAALSERRPDLIHLAITVALEDVALAITGHLGLLAEAALTGAGRPRIGNHLYGSFARDFRTHGGDSVMIVTLTARHFADLARATGLTETFAGLAGLLGADFLVDADRYAQREVIAALLAPWFARHTVAEIAAAFAGGSVLWERYRTFADLAAAPETLANPLVALIDQPGIGQVLATGSPLRQSGTEGPPPPAPVLGADNADLLQVAEEQEQTGDD